MRKLILTVGLPRAGKSTWAKWTNFPMVNPDSIRLALHGQPYLVNAEPMVWMFAEYMVKSLFEAGHEVIVIDATNGTPKRRRVWEELAEKLDAEVEYKLFLLSPFECKKRALADGRPELAPVIDRMAEEFDIEELDPDTGG